MTHYTIRSFDEYVLRTSSFSLSYYLNLINNYSSEKAIKTIETPFFSEAINLASPDFLELLNKLKKNPESFSSEKKEALTHTLLKYIARIAARSTPFGLFAGCTVGNFKEETNIQLQSYTQFERHTQFDMKFWVEFLKNLEKQPSVHESLKYFPNNSIYSSGDFYRYIEYKYVHKKREHSINAIRKTDLLESLLNHCKKGSRYADMLDLLADDESEMEEAKGYLEQLIDFQFIVSELEAGVTGSSEWDRISKIITKIPEAKKTQLLIENFQKHFKTIDNSLFDVNDSYNSIKEAIEKTGFEFDPKYLFQADLNIKTTVNTLNYSVSRKVKETLLFLNGIQDRRKHNHLESFKKAFIQRYETREMLLTTVLDTEIGIGYLQNHKTNDAHNLLDAFSFPSKPQLSKEELWTDYDFILEKKLQKAIQNKDSDILLSEKDFLNFESNWNSVPATFSATVEIIIVKEKEVISLESSGGTSAAKLLGRFCNGNEAIHQLTKKIVDKEKTHHASKITAEIVHIPESRTGNILKRPTLRSYEIPYLSISSVSNDFQIDINDLMISVLNDRIILRSKKHNKEVIPFLSNAHNYSHNALPIYHFLCDLSQQEVKPIYDFSWGNLESHYNYFPRVYYKEVIISKAKWFVTQKEIKSFMEISESQFENFKIWKKERNISKYVNWANGDNTLLLNLDQEICFHMFLNAFKGRNIIVLEEFLFNEQSVVTNEEGEYFVNQFIVPFYKVNK